MNGPNLDGCGWINELLPVIRLLTPKVKGAIFVHSFIPLFVCPAVTSLMKIIASFLPILKTQGHNLYLISKVCTYFFLIYMGEIFFCFFFFYIFLQATSLILVTL